MKTIRTVGIVIVFLSSFLVCSAAPKNKKDSRQFKEIIALIDSQQFKVNFNHAYPSGGQSVSLATNRGELVMQGDSVQGHLPFFGRAYSLPYGDSGGIEFDNRKVDSSIEIKEDKQLIVYKFSVSGRSDFFQILLTISSTGKCNMNVTSNSKTPISYSGEIQEIETH